MSSAADAHDGKASDAAPECVVLDHVPRWLLRMVTKQPPVDAMRVDGNVDRWTPQLRDALARTWKCDERMVLAEDTTFPPETAGLKEQASLRTVAISRLGASLAEHRTARAIIVRTTVDLTGDVVATCVAYVLPDHAAELQAAWASAQEEELAAAEQAAAPEVVAPISDVEPVVEPEPPPAPEPEPEWLADASDAMASSSGVDESGRSHALASARTQFLGVDDDVVEELAGVLDAATIRHAAAARVRWPRIGNGLAQISRSREGGIFVDGVAIDMREVPRWRWRGDPTADGSELVVTYRILGGRSRRGSLFSDRRGFTVRSRERFQYRRRR